MIQKTNEKVIFILNKQTKRLYNMNIKLIKMSSKFRHGDSEKSTISKKVIHPVIVGC